jgi:hypothetical protein
MVENNPSDLIDLARQQNKLLAHIGLLVGRITVLLTVLLILYALDILSRWLL